MEVRKLEDRDVSAVCEMVNARLLDSREAFFQLDGISDKKGLLESYTHARMRYWQRVGELWITGDRKGLLAGHFKKETHPFALARLSLDLLRGVLPALSKEDRSRLMQNMKRSAGAENVKWRRQVCGRDNYFYIDLIVLDRTLWGSGAFRRLLEPVLLRMERQGLPILLDTHDPDNVPLYRHFGFEPVGEHRAKGRCVKEVPEEPPFQTKQHGCLRAPERGCPVQINRLFQIVYYLLGKKKVTAQELAERLGVSRRTIFRDLDVLSLSGIPVYTERGSGGGI